MKKSLLIPLACVLVGCTTTIQPITESEQQHIAQTLPQISTNNGQLCVSRVADKYLCNKRLAFKFASDYGPIMGDVRTGNEYFCANLTPGVHYIAGTAQHSVYYAGAAIPTEYTVSQEIDIRSGERTFAEIRCGGMGDIELNQVSTERGLTGILNTPKFQKAHLQ